MATAHFYDSRFWPSMMDSSATLEIRVRSRTQFPLSVVISFTATCYGFLKVIDRFLAELPASEPTGSLLI